MGLATNGSPDPTRISGSACPPQVIRSPLPLASVAALPSSHPILQSFATSLLEPAAVCSLADRLLVSALAIAEIGRTSAQPIAVGQTVPYVRQTECPRPAPGRSKTPQQGNGLQTKASRTRHSAADTQASDPARCVPRGDPPQSNALRRVRNLDVGGLA